MTVSWVRDDTQTRGVSYRIYPTFINKEAIQTMENENLDVNLAEEVVKLQEEKERILAEKEEAERKRKEAELALINNRPAPKVKELDDPEVYAKRLQAVSSNKSMTNREYLENSVNFRKATINKYGVDPWSDKGVATEDTEEVAQAIETPLNEYEHDDEFNFRLNSVLKDDPNLLRKLREQRR